MLGYVVYALIDDEIKYVSKLNVTRMNGVTNVEFEFTTNVSIVNVNYEIDDVFEAQIALNLYGIDSNIFELNIFDDL